MGFQKSKTQKRAHHHRHRDDRTVCLSSLRFDTSHHHFQRVWCNGMFVVSDVDVQTSFRSVVRSALYLLKGIQCFLLVEKQKIFQKTSGIGFRVYTQFETSRDEERKYAFGEIQKTYLLKTSTKVRRETTLRPTRSREKTKKKTRAHAREWRTRNARFDRR